MSEQATRALVERLKTDEDFRARAFAVQDPLERLAFARAEGYDCTPEELAALGGAMDDAELEQVTGGLWPACETDCFLHGVVPGV